MSSLREYEIDHNSQWFKGLVDALAQTIPEDLSTILSTFSTNGYATVIDQKLIADHGTEEMLSGYADLIDTMTLADITTRAYIMEKIPFIRQCMAYIEAEYNPIENYQGTEHEVIEDEMGARSETTGLTKGQQIDTANYAQRQLTTQHGAHTDTDTIGSGGYDVTNHIAKKQTQVTPGTDTTENSVAPFDTDTYHNKEKTVASHTATTETESRVAEGNDGGNDKTSYSQRVDTRAYTQYSDVATDASHIDTMTAGQRVDSGSRSALGYTDTHTRDLDRHGNLGVMTAAQMMEYDYKYWEHFKWLSNMALDIVKLTCEGVICL